MFVYTRYVLIMSINSFRILILNIKQFQTYHTYRNFVREFKLDGHHLLSPDICNVIIRISLTHLKAKIIIFVTFIHNLRRRISEIAIDRTVYDIHIITKTFDSVTEILNMYKNSFYSFEGYRTICLQQDFQCRSKYFNLNMGYELIYL